MAGGMIGKRVNLDPTVLQPGANAPQPAGTTGMVFGPAQPMGQPQGPTLFDPNVGINMALQQPGQAGMMGAMGPSPVRGRGGPMRPDTGRRRQPGMTPRQVRPDRTMGRGAGAFGMRGRGPIPLQQRQVRGRGRGRRR